MTGLSFPEAPMMKRGDQSHILQHIVSSHRLLGSSSGLHFVKKYKARTIPLYSLSSVNVGDSEIAFCDWQGMTCRKMNHAARSPKKGDSFHTVYNGKGNYSSKGDIDGLW
jgi:hypothetical protein